MESKDAAKLKALAYDNAHWNRQVAMSKGFEWSKRMLNDMMLWASKYDEDEVIECLLSKVDLHHQEQNDAPRIVELVAQNDIETALQRIESFGGKDQEGLQRKFILYMLCLMELTLLDSKDKPFRKEAIEKLLKHLDDNLPVDHSVLNWNDFFPSYLVFLMACECAALGLDYMIIYIRTVDWGKEWISEKGPYSNLQFEVLLECAGCIIDNEKKSRALAVISIEQSNHGMADEATSTMQQSFFCARSIVKDEYKCRALADISTELSKQGKIEKAALAIQEALNCARGISDDYSKSLALKGISSELFKQSKVEKAALAMQEALSCAKGINNERGKKSCALADISIEQSKQGKVDEAAATIQASFSFARSIGDDDNQCSALANISCALAKQGKFKDALFCVNGIVDPYPDNYFKNNALKVISIELCKIGRDEEAITYSRHISSFDFKSRTLKEISAQLTKQMKFKEAEAAIREAISNAICIEDVVHKGYVLSEISIELSKQGKVESAVACARSISFLRARLIALVGMSDEQVKQRKIEDSRFTIMEALHSISSYDYEEYKRKILEDASFELAKQGKGKLAIVCAKGMPNEYLRGKLLTKISTVLAKNNKTEDGELCLTEALACIRNLNEEYAKFVGLLEVSNEFGRQGYFQRAQVIMKEAIECGQSIDSTAVNRIVQFEISMVLVKMGKLKEALSRIRRINDGYDKGIALTDISSELAMQGKVDEASSVMQEALNCAKSISDNLWKSRLLIYCSSELSKQGKIEQAALTIQGAFDCALGITEESTKSRALAEISIEQSKQGMADKALICARSISDSLWKSQWLIYNFIGLSKQGKVGAAESAMQQALTCARGLSSPSDESDALKDISTELAKQGNLMLAEQVSLEIPLTPRKFSCWKEIAKVSYEKHGISVAIHQADKFQNIEVKKVYLKGLADSIILRDCEKELILNAVRFYNNDIESMQKLLQQYALRELFFNESTEQRMDRFNRTLNIQWAIDLKNSLNA
jgi:tetratricopeptide (TPR) repeat protein